MKTLIDKFKSWGYGATLGAGGLGMLHAFGLFPDETDLPTAFSIGALVGVGIQRAVGRIVAFCWDQLVVWKSPGITQKRRCELSEEVAVYFIRAGRVKNGATDEAVKCQHDPSYRTPLHHTNSAGQSDEKLEQVLLFTRLHGELCTQPYRVCPHLMRWLAKRSPLCLPCLPNSGCSLQLLSEVRERT